MNKETVSKYLMLALGAALTLGSSIVNSKNQDAKMQEMIKEEVRKALENQTIGS